MLFGQNWSHYVPPILYTSLVCGKAVEHCKRHRATTSKLSFVRPTSCTQQGMEKLWEEQHNKNNKITHSESECRWSWSDLSLTTSSIIVENVSDGTSLFTFKPCSAEQLHESLQIIVENAKNVVCKLENAELSCANMPCNDATNNSEIVNMHSHSAADDVYKANLIDSKHENVINSTNIITDNVNANSCDNINSEKEMPQHVQRTNYESSSCTCAHFATLLSSDKQNNKSTLHTNGNNVYHNVVYDENTHQITHATLSLQEIHHELLLLSKVISSNASLLAGAESLETGIPLRYTSEALDHSLHLLSVVMTSMERTLELSKMKTQNCGKYDEYSREELLSDVQSRLPWTLRKQIDLLEKEHQLRVNAEHHYLLQCLQTSTGHTDSLAHASSTPAKSKYDSPDNLLTHSLVLAMTPPMYSLHHGVEVVLSSLLNKYCVRSDVVWLPSSSSALSAM